MANPDQFEAFVRAYQDMVYTTAARLLGNAPEAEDVAQQTFLRAWEHFDDLANSPTVGGWLKTVARNLSLNHLSRYRSRWRFFSEFTASDDSSDPGERELPFAIESDIEETVLTQDQRAILEEALARLPAAQRVALVLYHFEDLDYVDIAKKLGVSLGKVKTDIHRARVTLKKRLQPKVAEMGL